MMSSWDVGTYDFNLGVAHAYHNLDAAGGSDDCEINYKYDDVVTTSSTVMTVPS